MTPRCHGAMTVLDHESAYGQTLWRCSCGNEARTGPSDRSIARREDPPRVPSQTRTLEKQLEGEWT